MKYPNSTSYAWVSVIKSVPFLVLLSILFFVYILINCIFAETYRHWHVLKCATLLDYYYFSFVTALTIGYGDFSPTTMAGKIIVIIHSCTTAIYFSIMITALSAKIYHPSNTIFFSNKIIFNRQMGVLIVRILNTHKEALVSPEIRISVTEHSSGNVISRSYSVAKIDDIPYLGKHDFSLSFPDKIEISKDKYISVFEEIQTALVHDNGKSENEWSRFRIAISVSGNYGIQQMAFYKKYYANDIQAGTRFKAIQYNEEDQAKWWRNIDYSKFPNFWGDFNTIL